VTGELPISRLWGTPLRAGQVLLSTLGSNPKALFVHATPDHPVYPVDHWFILRFHEYPGAWALVLESSLIRAQLTRMVSGLVQQFIPPQRLPELVLPRLPDKLLARWQTALCQHHERQMQLEREKTAIIETAENCYRAVHGNHRSQRTAEG
jgi:hypothetical protein